MIRKAIKVSLLLLIIFGAIVWFKREIIAAEIIDHLVSELLISQQIKDVEKGEFEVSFLGATLSFLKGTLGNTTFKAKEIDAKYPDIFKGNVDSLTAKSSDVTIACSENSSKDQSFKISPLPLRLVSIGKLNLIYKSCEGVSLEFKSITSPAIEIINTGNDGSIINVKSFSASLFGGKIVVHPFSIKDGVIPKTFKISLTEIDLSKLMEMYEVSTKIKVSGDLNAEVPISFLDFRNFAVKDGTLSGKSGRIEWPYEPGDEKSQFNEYARKALQDFSYSDMTGKFSLSAPGDLIITLNLIGIAPNVHKTRPLHLNLTVEENIPKLIKSLRLLNRFPTELVEKYRE